VVLMDCLASEFAGSAFRDLLPAPPTDG
jgi:hypothetical protein